MQLYSRLQSTYLHYYKHDHHQHNFFFLHSHTTINLIYIIRHFSIFSYFFSESVYRHLFRAKIKLETEKKMYQKNVVPRASHPGSCQWRRRTQCICFVQRGKGKEEIKYRCKEREEKKQGRWGEMGVVEITRDFKMYYLFINSYHFLIFFVGKV